MFEVLLYLFQGIVSEEAICPDTDSLGAELEAAGFSQREISRAFGWLEDLAIQQHEEDISASEASTRIWSIDELMILAPGCQEFLLFLQTNKVITAKEREIIIERALALGVKHVSLDAFKWVSFIVICGMESDNYDINWIEDFIFAEFEFDQETLH
ncbi:MAG: hypothetical protein CMF50_05390 [Legionellales bacterium]|nr:hypothetical protein [Legionellales bacterium]|tara:strand:- start:133381 stop:133848 length:468 start_codon:yes stop_codon:yes gene_type:complete